MHLTMPLPWGTVALLGAVWVLLAGHTAVSMARYGRRGWVWFLITLVLTPVPAAVVSCADWFVSLRRRQVSQRAGDIEDEAPAGDAGDRPVRRCRHCGAVLAGQVGKRIGGRLLCPNCRLPVEEDQLA
jgi:hypothetical protein